MVLHSLILILLLNLITPATTIRMNQSSNASNGFFNGRYAISHNNNSTIGNYTNFWLLVEVTLSGVLVELGLILFISKNGYYIYNN